MPPKRKTSSFFFGPGRVLGSGEEKSTKRSRKTVREDDDADYVPPTDKKEELDNEDADYVPVMRGKQIVRKGKTETQDAVSNETADVQDRSAKKKSPSQLLKDETHDEDKQSGHRGREAKSKAKKAVMMDPVDGMDAADESGDDLAPEGIADIAIGTLRSGAGRGFYKYGEGQTLGEAQVEGEEPKAVD